MGIFLVLRSIIGKMIADAEFYRAYGFHNPSWQVVVVIDGEVCD